MTISGRGFRMRLLGFGNGCFLMVSEGEEERIGSLTLSMKIHDKVEHTSVIPEMRAGVFASVLADLAANLVPGITIVSLYLKSELRPDAAQELLKRIQDFLKEARAAVESD